MCMYVNGSDNSTRKKNFKFHNTSYSNLLTAFDFVLFKLQAVKTGNINRKIIFVGSYSKANW